MVGGPLDSVVELHAGPRVFGEQEVAVEVDVVAQARDLCGSCDAETRLDHAAEHDAEVERARRVCHAHGLADAAGLRELDVDAVRPLGAGRDVAQPMAVLVDVDRDRRRGLQARTVGVAGRQGLLAVRDTELRKLG